MQRLALLCWECGSGRGHVVTLSNIARALKARGWNCILALPPGDHEALGPDGLQVHVTPQWGAGAETPMRKTDSSASMADVLAEIGLQSAERVLRKIDDWHRVFAEHSPNLVVADFAPGAILAARGRVPCLAVGTGYAVPPPDVSRFPLLHDLALPLYQESAVRETVNGVMRKLGTKPLDRLVEALAGDARAVCTVPLLDPYSAGRKEPLLGPMLSAPVALRDRGAAEIFCYLREGKRTERIAEMAGSLAGIPGRVVAYVPDLAPEARQELRTRGVDVIDAPAPMTEQLRKSRLVVHFGGHGIAAAALLAGVPQVVLQFDVEKMLIANALGKRGVARSFDYRSAGAAEVNKGIRTALADHPMLMAAKEAAAEHQEYRNRDVVGEIATMCERLAA